MQGEAPALDIYGFEFVPKHVSKVKDFYNPSEVLESYTPEVEAVIRRNFPGEVVLFLFLLHFHPPQP
jgi:hypothetical protein